MYVFSAGWDINSLDLASAMRRAAVLEHGLQEQLAPLMAHLKPRPALYSPDFIAANQEDRFVISHQTWRQLRFSNTITITAYVKWSIKSNPLQGVDF
jgi:hypothetical protein